MPERLARIVTSMGRTASPVTALILGVIVLVLTAGVVHKTLEPAHVSVWISRRGPGVS